MSRAFGKISRRSPRDPAGRSGKTNHRQRRRFLQSAGQAMTNPFLLIRKNAGTAAMIFFVLIFYAVFMLPSRATKEQTTTVTGQKSDRMTGKELRERESRFQKAIEANPV